MTGEIIRGRVLVTQTKDFMASELVVGIHGSEQTYFCLHADSHNASIFTGKRPFIYKSFQVATYNDNESPVGS